MNSGRQNDSPTHRRSAKTPLPPDADAAAEAIQARQDNRLLAIVGPTAIGKTEVAILLAEALDGEIVSADSMQIYRGMDIGSAKPTAGQLSRVPHHLIDLLQPDEPFSVADYRRLADAALADIWSRGRQPILVGGSGLYVRAVLDEMDFGEVPPDQQFRSRLREEADRLGRRALHERLANLSPETSARIHPNDLKRIIRALEVLEKIGRPPIVDQPRRPRYNDRRFGLIMARRELYQRIEQRVDKMLELGLVEEVRGLLQKGYSEHLVSMKGLGYAQLTACLRGDKILADAVSELKRDTRRFAKRQIIWFRTDKRICWIDLLAIGGAEAAAKEILKRWR